MTQEIPNNASWDRESREFRHQRREERREERRRLRQERHNSPCSGYSAGLAWGLVLMIGGGLLLLNNLDMLQFRVWQIWPLAMLVSGVVVVVRSRRSGEAVFGVITAAIGGFFLLSTMGLPIPGIREWFWPTLFIGAGVMMLVNHYRDFDRDRRVDSWQDGNHNGPNDFPQP